MKSLKTAFRMSMALASLSACMLLLLHASGAIPDATIAVLQGRKALCEAMAIYCSSAAIRDDRATIAATTRALVERNDDIASASVVKADGTVIVRAGEPEVSRTKAFRSTPNIAEVPIYLNNRRWGVIEVHFRTLNPLKEFLLFDNSTSPFIAFFAALNFVTSLFYLWIVLHRQRTQNGAIPERVRATLDTLVEGVLLLDSERRIALANESFARTVGASPEDLEGQSADSLEWTAPAGRVAADNLPWEDIDAEESIRLNSIVGLKTGAEEIRTLSVNATAIIDDDGTSRGVLATFDDMTPIQAKNAQLKRSRAKIRRQNQKLVDLATLDPLTSCLNRRAFFERAEVVWKTAARHGHQVSCVMLDIDHFKSVNDRFGHGVGDVAIQTVSGVIRGQYPRRRPGLPLRW